MIDFFLFLSMDSYEWTDDTNSQQVYIKQVGCTMYLPSNVGNRHVDIQRDFSLALVFLCFQSMRAVTQNLMSSIPRKLTPLCTTVESFCAIMLSTRVEVFNDIHLKVLHRSHR